MITACIVHLRTLDAFTVSPPSSLTLQQHQRHYEKSTAFTSSSSSLYKKKKRNDDPFDDGEDCLKQVPEEDQNIITLLDKKDANFIECNPDAIAIVNGNEYIIASPCDNCVALCSFSKETEELLPIELDEELMNDVFPVAARFVADEFGDELSLERTAQTLTLVGELEMDEDDEDDEDENDDEASSDEEEVEFLLEFEHRNKDFYLVRLLDPVMLVGKREGEDDDKYVVLSEDESAKVMPTIEEMFMGM